MYLQLETKDNAGIHSILWGIYCGPKNSVYINNPVSRSSESGSVMGYMNAEFVSAPVLWLSSLSLDGGGSHVMPRPSPYYVAVPPLALLRL